MTTAQTLEALLLCGLMGTLGQGVRAILGVQSSSSATDKSAGAQSTFDVAYLLITLVIGTAAGMVAGLSLGLDTINTDSSNLKMLLGIFAAGYAGVDFIESTLSKLAPNILGPKAAAAQNNQLLGAGNANPGNNAANAPQAGPAVNPASNMSFATHLVANDKTIVSADQILAIVKQSGSPVDSTQPGNAATAPEASDQTPPDLVYGFDCENYPGAQAMDFLRGQAHFRICVCYLANEPGLENKTWTSQYKYLRSTGWGLLPTYAGLQINAAGLSAAAGTRDGAEAVQIMTNAGFPASSIVYLDLEDGDTPAGPYLQYIKAWVAAVQSGNFTPALYCSYLLVDWARNKAKLTDIIWSFKIPNRTGNSVYDPDKIPPGTIVPGSIATQYRQKVNLSGLTIPPTVDSDGLDFNVCAVADPSNLASVNHALNL